MPGLLAVPGTALESAARPFPLALKPLWPLCSSSAPGRGTSLFSHDPDVAVCWDCHICHCCGLLTGQKLLVYLELKILQERSPVVLNHRTSCAPSQPLSGAFQCMQSQFASYILTLLSAAGSNAQGLFLRLHDQSLCAAGLLAVSHFLYLSAAQPTQGLGHP